jgi:hypothetical protein
MHGCYGAAGAGSGAGTAAPDAPTRCHPCRAALSLVRSASPMSRHFVDSLALRTGAIETFVRTRFRTQRQYMSKRIWITNDLDLDRDRPAI